MKANALDSKLYIEL
jgi:hypothetical protein